MQHTHQCRIYICSLDIPISLELCIQGIVMIHLLFQCHFVCRRNDMPAGKRNSYMGRCRSNIYLFMFFFTTLLCRIKFVAGKIYVFMLHLSLARLVVAAIQPVSHSTRNIIFIKIFCIKCACNNTHCDRLDLMKI